MFEHETVDRPSDTMQLIDLPAELLTMIAWQVDAEDFENFALSCRKLYKCSEPRFEDHHKFVRTFRTFIVKDYRWPSLTSPARPEDHCGLNGQVIFADALEAFNELVDHPGRAQYVHRLTTCHEGQYSLYNDELDLHLLVEKMRRFVANRVDLKDSLQWAQRMDDITEEINKDWSRRQVSGELTESTAMILIPHLCPNLRHLSRSICMDGKLYHETEILSSFIDPRSWENLEQAHVAVQEAIGDENQELGRRQLWSLIKQLMKVSSIRSIYAQDVDSDGASFNSWEESDICSNLEGLFLEEGNEVSATDMGALLQRVPKLEQLRYTYRTMGSRRHRDGESNSVSRGQGSAPSFFDQIVNKSGSTLKKLSLVGWPMSLEEPLWNGCTYPLGHFYDFSQFTCLEELHTYIVWLLNPKIDQDKGLYSSENSLQEFLLRDEDPLPSNLLAPRLPRTLRTLALAEGMTMRYEAPDYELQVEADVEWKRMHGLVLRELFGAPVRSITCFLPHLSSIQLDEPPETFVTELQNSLATSDCIVSTGILLQFPDWDDEHH